MSLAALQKGCGTNFLLPAGPLFGILVWMRKARHQDGAPKVVPRTSGVVPVLGVQGGLALAAYSVRGLAAGVGRAQLDETTKL